MATQESAADRKPATITGIVFFIIVGILIVTAGTIAGFRLMTEWPAIRGASPAQPTAYVVPTVRSQGAPAFQPNDAPAAQATPIPGVAQNAATAQALFDAAVRAAEQPVAVPNTGQDIPVVIEQRPAEERHAAGDNVPTAEPVVQAESGGIFGSKPVLINPQETHECKHGQQWVEGKGCRNP